MRKLLTVGALVSCLSLVAVSPASAATEVGEPCTATGAEANRTLLVFNVTTAHPVVPEEPAQVITSWTVRVGAGIAPLPQRLEVYRVLNEEQDYRKEGESATVTVREGVNVFPTRIPVKSFTGYLALHGPNGTFVCDPAPQLAGSFEGGAAIGETRRVSTAIGLGVPLTATVEDDRDGDGYGDETQDGCPQSAAYQGPCPTITLDAFPIVLKRSVLVLVSSSSTTPVQVFGQVGLKLGPTADGPAHISKTRKPGKVKPTGQIFGLAGGTQSVNPGELAPFNVKLPKAVKSRLSQMTPKETLRASLAASTTDLLGRVATKVLTIRLPGQKRPG